LRRKRGIAMIKRSIATSVVVAFAAGFVEAQGLLDAA
jgi:hypothetical protein